MLRLVVTGSRDFRSERLVREYIFEAIETWRKESKDARYARLDWSSYQHVTLIHGKARGFDTLAASVGEACGMRVVGIGADWNGPIGRDAGTSRNWQLIIEGNPNYGLVGPGEYGTGHMQGALRSSGVPFLDKSALPIV